MGRALTLLVVLAIVPLLLAQVGIYSLWVQSRQTLDLRNNFAIAQAVAMAFDDFVHDMSRQELAVGIAVEWLKPQSSARMASYLKTNASEIPPVRVWDLVDSQGKTVASTDPQKVGQQIDVGAAWYQEILGGREWIVTDMLPGRPGNPPVFLIARRIEDEEHRLLGVSVAEIDANRLGVLVHHIERAEGGMFALLDRRGNLVYIDPQVQVAQRDLRSIDPVLDAALTTGEPATGTFVSPIDGRERVAARIPVGDTGWVAGSSRPTSVLLAPVLRSLWLIGLLNLAAIGLSAAAVGFLGRQMLRSLRSLQVHSQAVGQGDLGYRAEVSGIRELEQLADSFNSMGVKLQEARQAQQEANTVLERRVAERTAELSALNESLAREIAERTWSQTVLKEQSRILEAFFLHTLGPLVFLDKDFRFLRVNMAYARSCGRDVTEFPGHNHFDFYPSDTRELFEEVVRSKRPCEVFARPFVFPDQPERGVTYWDWTLVPVLDSRGEVDFLIFSLQDVTQRKLAEERLRDSERKLRAIFDHTFQFVGLLTPEGTVVEANRGAMEAIGQEKAAVIGKPFWDTPWWRHSEAMQEKLRAAVRTAAEGQFVRFEATHLAHDDQLIYVDFSLMPVHDENGQVVLLVPEGRDITERKQAEEELTRYREHLEELVAQRTAELELANRRLEAEITQRKLAAEALKEADRRKDEFLANTSHELRTPMNAILGMTELALAESLAPEIREYLETARNSARVLLALLNEILDFSRIEAGKFELRPAPFRLRAILDETMKVLAIRAHEKGIELACDVPLDLPDGLIGDPLRVQQVLVNLVGNAVKFTEQGEVVLTVRHVEPSSDAVELEFAVTDTGIGISREDQERIFAPFAQADASTTRAYGGSGLGLAIAASLAGMMHGGLRVESELGKGSTFHFTARFLRHPDYDLPPNWCQAPEPLRGARVLIADRNATNRRILESILSSWGLTAESTGDSQTALSRITAAAQSGQRFRLLLLEAGLHGANGHTLAKAIEGGVAPGGARPPDGHADGSSHAHQAGHANRDRQSLGETDLADRTVPGDPARDGNRRRPRSPRPRYSRRAAPLPNRRAKTSHPSGRGYASQSPAGRPHARQTRSLDPRSGRRSGGPGVGRPRAV